MSASGFVKPVLLTCLVLPSVLSAVPQWCWLPVLGLMGVQYLRHRAISEAEAGIAELEKLANGEKR